MKRSIESLLREWHRLDRDISETPEEDRYDQCYRETVSQQLDVQDELRTRSLTLNEIHGWTPEE